MKDRPGEAGSAQRRSAWGGLRRTLAVTADRPQGPAVGGAGECGSPEIPSKTPSFAPLLAPTPTLLLPVAGTPLSWRGPLRVSGGLRDGTGRRRGDSRSATPPSPTPGP